MSAIRRRRCLRPSVCLLALVISLLHAAAIIAEDSKPSATALIEVFHDDFENGADHWEPTDTAAWRIVAADDNHVFDQFKQSDYQPPHRSPHNVALVKELNVADFTLVTRLKSTARDYPHRSLCLFFGYQDPAHFYYVHLGQRTDDHANQIFIVNDAPRTKISTKTTPGTKWDNEWHRVKIHRSVKDGTIAVYFDDMESPVMTAQDKTFTWGRVGVGSFDDTGNWDDFRLWTPSD